MKYLLDTDTVSNALRGIGGVADRLRAELPADIAIAAITEAELWYGVEKRGTEKLRQRVAAFLQPIQVVAFDSKAARCFGRLQVRLEKAGLPIGMAEAMIAAVGMAGNLIVVTRNRRHFTRIHGLRTEDWS